MTDEELKELASKVGMAIKLENPKPDMHASSSRANRPKTKRSNRASRFIPALWTGSQQSTRF